MGLIFDIKRFAVHDGPGIRTTVFMKGCPLACQWCHNPESISSAICTVPKRTVLDGKSYATDETVGREITVDELMLEILKDRVFMEESGGGVTFSGGEPLMQASFLKDMLTKCKEEGLHTVVDTSGYATLEVLKQIAPLTDLFLYDLKVMDDEVHRRLTGVSNRLILQNLSYLVNNDFAVRVRIPVVPGVSDRSENITDTIAFLSKLGKPVQGVDLLAFHRTAQHKYERFGIENHFQNTPAVQKSELSVLQEQFKAAGFE